MIDEYGLMGTISSSRRYKEDIHDMADASSDLLRLRPVTFRYKKPYPASWMHWTRRAWPRQPAFGRLS
jgi:hypothetical protein